MTQNFKIKPLMCVYSILNFLNYLTDYLILYKKNIDKTNKSILKIITK